MLVAFLTLSAASLFLYERFNHGFEVEDAEFISDHIFSLRREVADHPGDLTVAREIIGSTAASHALEKFYGRLVDDKGQLLAETPGYAELAPPPADFPPAVPATDRIQKPTSASSPGGVPLYIAAAYVTHSPLHPPLHYSVVMNITHLDVWMAEMRSHLAVVVLAGTIVSALLAWLLTKNGLRPLREIGETMKSVGSGGLEQRLGSNRWPQELASLAEEFDHMLERLQESFQRLSQFSADAAHEFRTPLNNLMVATSFLLSRNHDKEEYKQALAANFEEYERLKVLVERLLFLARAENAEAVLTKTEIDASLLAGEVLDFFSAVGEERGVTLTCEGKGTLSADKTLVRMALVNLVSNALRHTPKGGQVRLEIHEDVRACRIVVSDTGTGIAPQHLPRLFDRFYRVDEARANVHADTGSGLGLALVKTIATLHNGSITVQSKELAGTTMTLVLPRPEVGAVFNENVISKSPSS